MRILKLAALGAALTVAGHGVASASALTWLPGSASPALNGGPIVNFNNFNVTDYADIVITNPGSPAATFVEHGVLNIANFLNSNLGTQIVAPGLGSTYSLYVTFTATGNLAGIPATVGAATSGAFSSLSYELWGSPNSTPVIKPVPGGKPTITHNAGAFELATGSLVGGTVSLTAAGNHYGSSHVTGYVAAVPNLDLTLVAQPGEAGFFNGISSFGLVANFSATTTETKLTNSNHYLDIYGGGGNITPELPEPSTLAVLGSSLLALGLIASRRRRS
jgi:hypothetical protein